VGHFKKEAILMVIMFLSVIMILLMVVLVKFVFPAEAGIRMILRAG
jgi:hypothetical protein